jgi:hypothetical protein
MAEMTLVEVVRRIAVVFGRRQVSHALIGGLAVSLRSRPRATKDADFIVHVPAIDFPGLLEELIREGFELDVMDIVRRWSADRFVAFWQGQVRVDWMQPVLPLYANVIRTAEVKPWLDANIRLATSEGLIITKMVAFRPQDQADIAALLIANRDQIDLAFIRHEWSSVAKGEEARTLWLENAIAELVDQRQG